MAGEIGGISCRIEDVPEDRAVDFVRVDACALDRCFRDVGGEVGNRYVSKRSAEGPEGSADCGQEDDWIVRCCLHLFLRPIRQAAEV